MTNTQSYKEISFAYACLQQSKLCLRDNKYKQAEYLLNKATKLLKVEKKWTLYIKSQIYLGRCKIHLRDFDAAITASETAYLVCIQELGDQHPLMGDIFCSLGFLYFKKGKFEKALEWYKLALELKQMVYDANHIALAKCYNLVGLAHSGLGYSEEGLHAHEKALSIALSHSSTDPLFLTEVYMGIGHCYLRRSDVGEALNVFHKALSIRLDLLSEKHTLTAQTYNEIGNVLLIKEDYQDAFLAYKKSLSINLEIFGSNHIDISRNYNGLASCHFNFQEYEEALRLYQKGLSINTKILGGKNPYAAVNYINLAKCYTVKKYYDLALGMYKRAASMGKEFWGEYHQNVSHTIIDMGRCCHKKGDYKAAINYFHKALINIIEDFEDTHPDSNPTLANYNNAFELQKALNGKALSYFFEYKENSNSLIDLKKSLNCYELSIQLIDQMRNGYKAEASKLSLAQRAVPLYDEAIDVALTLYKETSFEQYLHKAFYFSEKSKSILLLSSMREAEAQMTANISSDLLEDMRMMRNKLTKLEHKISNEQSKDRLKRQEGKLIAWKSQQFDDTQHYEQLIKKIEKEYPEYYQLKYNVKVTDVVHIQGYLEQKKAALLSYFVGNQNIYIFCVTSTRIKVEKLPIPKIFDRIIKDFEIGMAGFFPKLVRSAFILYKWLVEPIKNLLNGIEQLIVLPDGVLHKVSFDTLLSQKCKDNQGIASLPYLIKDYSITYHYSATLLLYTSKRSYKTAELVDSFMGLAPISFEKKEAIPLSFNAMRGKNTLKNLENAEVEVKKISELFQNNGLESKTLIHQEANKENLCKYISEYKFVLLATHGFIDPNQPELSGLYLHPIVQEKAKNSVESHKFYTSEAFNLKLQADLVILSACETGRGKFLQGEGVMALNRGFLYSGASNVIYTLYKIPDQSSSQLMQYFFKLIVEEEYSYTEALQKAKLQFIEAGKSPCHWASFALIGS